MSEMKARGQERAASVGVSSQRAVQRRIMQLLIGVINIIVGCPNMHRLPSGELRPNGKRPPGRQLLLQTQRYRYPRGWRVCWPAMKSTTVRGPEPNQDSALDLLSP